MSERKRDYLLFLEDILNAIEKIYDLVKSHRNDGFEKSSRCKARKN